MAEALAGVDLQQQQLQALWLLLQALAAQGEGRLQLTHELQDLGLALQCCDLMGLMAQ